MVSITEYSGHFTSLIGIWTIIFIQVLCGICNGSLFKVNNEQIPMNDIEKSDSSQTIPLLQASFLSTKSKSDEIPTPPSCPNLRNPFTPFSEKSIQQHPNGEEYLISKGNRKVIVPEFPFSRNTNFNPTSNLKKTNFVDSYTNKASGQSPYINQSSQMYYQYNNPGHPPVRMVCYYNSKNGLGNYYIYRGKRGESGRNSYFHAPMICGVENTLKNRVIKHGHAENITTSIKNNFPGSDSIKKEDLSLIMDTLSPIYDWANQKHREVSDIDRYECLINLITRLKCRVADEKKKYLASLSEPLESSMKNSDIQELHDRATAAPPQKFNDKNIQIDLSSVTIGEESPQSQRLNKKNEESKIFNLDPVLCDTLDEQLTSLEINKRQVYPPTCDCSYSLKKRGKCPCGSSPSNQRRYYGT